MPERLITFFGDVKKEFSEWQKEGKLKDFAYLFSIDVEFNDVLNNDTITEKLNNIFKTEGFPISQNVMVTKDKGDSWVITDGEKKYIVEKEYGKLNIYDSAKPVAKGFSEMALKDRPPSVLREIIKNVIDKPYLFSWDNLPGNDSEELLKFLRDDQDIGWAENAEIHKSDDGKIIRIFKDENSAEIIIDEKKEKARLKISDGRILDLKVKNENGKLNLYDMPFPDEKEELLKELKGFSENQLEEVSSKIDVSVENLKVIQKVTLSTLEEILSEVKETKGRYSEFIIVDEVVDPALGVDLIADELSKLLINMENERGKMVGIFGKWGRGKTFLMNQIWDKLKSQHKPLFCRVDFQAWKYQDTPASWAYLYEEFAKKYYDKPKNTFTLSWFTYWKKILSLNFKRKGWLPLISVLVGILTSLLLVSLFGYLQSENMLGGNTAIIGISVTLFGSVVGIWKYLKKEYGFKAIELFKDYSEKQSFKQFLGIQAEIQEELKILLEAWIPDSKKKSYLFSWDSVPGDDDKKLKESLRDDQDIGWAENAEIHKSDDGKTISIRKDENLAEIIIDDKKEKARLKISGGKTLDLKVKKENGKLNIYKKSKAPRILLFVDDIDRCSEERIIQIIDSLRVMLEADVIYQRIIVISAIDEDVLKRALKWKYSSFFNDDKENNKKSEKLDDLVKEYMDKLFLIGIKLGQLTKDETKEIFDIYTISRDIVAPNQQDRPVKKETTSETGSREVTPTKSVAGDEPKAELNKEEQRGDNLEGKKEENKYELSHEEYEFLLAYINLIEDATPRKVRIFYYRYLLARNLLEIKLRSPELERIWSPETDKLAIPRLILNESNPTKKLYSFNKESSNSTSDKINMNIDPKILEELTKIIKMVVAY